jgi:hypothetical protein
MTVGQSIPTKFTWLLDNVEVRGIVQGLEGDVLDLVPDPNYQHLIALFRGNNPLLWKPLGDPAVIHCETNPIGPHGTGSIDRDEPWALPQMPPDQMLTGTDSMGATRDLQVGDHIQVFGRWCIDHHPEFCNPPDQKPSLSITDTQPYRCRKRGALRVGPVHTELHPYYWDNIRILDRQYYETDEVILSLAAPIHEEQYLGSWKWVGNECAGVAGKVFIDPDGSNFHPTVSADMTIEGPPVSEATMQMLGAQAKILRWSEQVYVNGTGLSPDLVRTIEPFRERLRVTASVTAPGQLRADVHDPARGRSVFQAKYTVHWDFIGSQISCINKPHRQDSHDRIHAVGGKLAGGFTWILPLDQAIDLVDQGFSFFVENTGTGLHIPVVTAVSEAGHRYLRTVTDYDVADNLLSLPECVPEELV